MEKVIVIGCPGAGKSTFARKLQEKTNLPLYYLDMIWHKPDKTNISRDEFDMKLVEILQKDKWIIDGNYDRTLELRMDKCDTIFLLDFPLEVCLKGVEERIGKKREDMPWVETEFDEEFHQWILDFHKYKITGLYDLVEKYKSQKEIILFKTREETDFYLKRFIEKI